MSLVVHRTLVKERGIVHRDMSINNVLMYPQHRKMNKPVMKKRPPLIDDVLAGHMA